LKAETLFDTPDSTLVTFTNDEWKADIPKTPDRTLRAEKLNTITL